MGHDVDGKLRPLGGGHGCKVRAAARLVTGRSRTGHTCPQQTEPGYPFRYGVVDRASRVADLSRLSSFRFPDAQLVEFLSDFFDRLRDLPALVQWAGYVGLTAIIFTETGLLIGFFLPGDSLLVTAGLLASQPEFGLNVYILGCLLTVAAIVGDSVGYSIGKASGPRIFTREDSFFFRRSHLLKAQEFYERHGGKTIIIARFVPIIRTFAPVVAGVGQMQYRSFLMYNIVGGALWIWSMLFTGYFLGRWVPGIDQHIEKVIMVVIFLSILPGIIAWWRERQRPATPTA